MSESDRAEGHEQDDVSVRGILWFAGGLLVLAVVTHLTMWWLFDYFFAREQRLKQSPFPLAGLERNALPPEPRLEGIEPLHGRPALSRPPDTLNRYGWVDAKAGVVHIPIRQAMELLVQEGRLPSEPEGKPGKERP